MIGPLIATPANNPKPAKDSRPMDFLHTPPLRCLGVDVAKDNLVASDGTRILTVDNNRCGIRALLKTMRPDFVICEPTGGYELMLLEECLKVGITCHRADVMKLKAYIRSMGTLGKSDAIDARQMAAYGCERWARLPLWHAPDADEMELQVLVRRRADLVALRVAEHNRSKAPGAKAIAASFKAMLGAIQRQIDALDGQIAALPSQRKRKRQRSTATARRKAPGQNRIVHARNVCSTGKGTVRPLLQTPHPKRKTAHRRYRRNHAKDRRDYKRKAQRRLVTTELMTPECLA
ncbi:transposase [Agrobacterium rhizogenes]|uniref:IS110 family transposase n=1 Tax=Rhizobium rhizogenes TaxID=359 RepID=UPI0022B6216D|nr:transposase [Rhizobium rhizogenes]MCZ7448632.1 transposase [Rhizobium rhizogenes]